MSSKQAIPIACVGWFIAIGLAAVIVYLLPRLHVQALERPPQWDSLVQQRQAEIAAFTWKDSRPLSLWLGDSHVELGNWYDLFGGAFAVRNCGMSMASIRDVQALVKSIPDTPAKTVVLLCGINNVLRGEAVEPSAKEYEALLKEVRARLHPQFLVVIAVLPLRQNAVDARSQEVNKRVSELNARLKELCQNQGNAFFNANPTLVDSSGGLSVKLTDDGLHLNRKGYQVFASEIRKSLPE